MDFQRAPITACCDPFALSGLLRRPALGVRPPLSAWLRGQATARPLASTTAALLLLLVALAAGAQGLSDDELEVEAPSADAPAPGLPLSMQEAELAATEQRLEALRAQLTDQEAYRDALYAELERNDRDIAALARAERELAAERDEQEARGVALGTRLDATRGDLSDARSRLAALIRSAYAVGPGDRLRLLLNQQDPARAGRQLGYYRAIGRLRAARVGEVARLAAELEQLGAAARKEADRLARLVAEQAQTRLALEAVRAARGAVVADLEQAIIDDRARVTELDANAAALRKLVEELRARARIADEIAITQEPITRRHGKLPWPVADSAILRAYAGNARPGDLHADGILFAVEPGREVFPVHHGQVAYADWLRGFGLLVIVDHGDGYMTFYGHNQALLKEVGEWVGPGDVIALAGTGPGTDLKTDNGSGANGRLYFALRREGRSLNPRPWLAAGPG
jgi:murein hydrolase activator